MAGAVRVTVTESKTLPGVQYISIYAAGQVLRNISTKDARDVIYALKTTLADKNPEWTAHTYE